MKGMGIPPIRPMQAGGYVHGEGAQHADRLLRTPTLGLSGKGAMQGLTAPKASLGPAGGADRIIGRKVAYNSPASVGSKAGKAKVEKTMGEFKRGTLHSGSKTGPKVTGRKQAIAIALNQARRGK